MQRILSYTKGNHFKINRLPTTFNNARFLSESTQVKVQNLPTIATVQQRYDTSIFELRKQSPQTILDISSRIEKLEAWENKYETKALLKHLVCGNKKKKSATAETSKATKYTPDKIVRIIADNITHEDMLHLRWLVQYKIISFPFNMRQVNSIIEACSQSNHIIEAYQWYLIARDILELTPNNYTYYAMLPGLAKAKQWDLFHLVYQDMRSYEGCNMTNGLLNSMLVLSTDQWSSNWRWLRQVLLDIDDKIYFEPAKMKTIEPTESLITDWDQSAVQLSTYQNTLARLLSINPAAVVEYYHHITERHPLPTDSHPKQLSRLHAIYHPNNLLTFATAGFAIKSTTFVKRVLGTYIKSRGRSDQTWMQALGASSDLGFWMLGLELHLTKRLTIIPNSSITTASIVIEDDVYVLMSHLLRAKEFVRARKLWDLIAAHYGEDVIGLGHGLHALCQLACPHVRTTSVSHALESLSSFLTMILPLPDSLSSTSSSSQQQLPSTAVSKPTLSPTLLPALLLTTNPTTNNTLLQVLLDLYYTLHDTSMITSLALYALQSNVTLSEESMNLILETLQASGDHKLVVELFDMYSQQQHTPGRSSKQQQLEACPHLYHTVLHSLAKIGEMDMMLKFMKEELPRQNYKLSPVLYNTAILGLTEHGHYTQAMTLFHEMQRTSTTLLNSVDYKLITTVLHTCAKGRLAYEAVSLFMSLQESQIIGAQMKLSSSQFATLSQLVIVALSTSDTVQQIMPFLLSTETLPRSFLVTRKLIVVAFTAGILLRNEGLIEQVWALNKAKHGGSNLAVKLNEVEELAESLFSRVLSDEEKVFFQQVMEKEYEDGDFDILS